MSYEAALKWEHGCNWNIQDGLSASRAGLGKLGLHSPGEMPQAKNRFYILKWLGGGGRGSKRKIFHNMLKLYEKSNFGVQKFYQHTATLVCFHVAWLHLRCSGHRACKAAIIFYLTLHRKSLLTAAPESLSPQTSLH